MNSFSRKTVVGRLWKVAVASVACMLFSVSFVTHILKEGHYYTITRRRLWWFIKFFSMTMFSKCCITITTIAAFSTLSSHNIFRQSNGKSSRLLSSFVHSATLASAMAMPNMKTLSYLDASSAKDIDAKLMKSPGFSLDQLMELAGHGQQPTEVKI